MGRAATAALRACLALTVLGASSDADALPTEGAARRLQPSLLNASSEAALSGCAWEQFDDLLKAAGTACCGATDCLDKGATLGLNQSCSVACASTFAPRRQPCPRASGALPRSACARRGSRSLQRPSPARTAPPPASRVRWDPERPPRAAGAKSYSPLFYLPCTSIVDVLCVAHATRHTSHARALQTAPTKPVRRAFSVRLAARTAQVRRQAVAPRLLRHPPRQLQRRRERKRHRHSRNPCRGGGGGGGGACDRERSTRRAERARDPRPEVREDRSICHGRAVDTGLLPCVHERERMLLQREGQHGAPRGSEFRNSGEGLPGANKQNRL